MQDILDRSAFGATLLQWLIAAGTLGGVYALLAVIRKVALTRLAAIAARTTMQWDDLALEILRRTRPYFLFVLALQAALRVIPPDARVGGVLTNFSIVLVLIQVGVWGGGLIGFAVNHYSRMREEGDVGARTTIQAVGYGGRFLLWALLAVTALDHFGIQVTALVAGLGVGGIAIALAVQNILGDLFAALAIVLDKPFVVGDFIIVDTVLGTVEHIGLKTTRLRSLGGEQIIISNNDLLKSRIRNYKRMEQRRIVFTLDVTYDTPPEQMDRLPAIIREVVEGQKLTRFDRSHFLTFAESSLRIETVYFVLAADYHTYANTQHAINMALLRRFAAEKIEFAFPTRTVHHHGSGDATAP
ncbi:MAG: mechanosensitive ion channel family protein [Gemmatimonadaceae bacterium]